MNMSTPEIEELKRIVEQRYGKRLLTTTDFEEFSLHLQNKYRLAVSSSTLKRLYGYVGDMHKPRVATLDQLAVYIGHRNYTAFVEWLKTTSRYNSSFFNASQVLSSSLAVGDMVEIGWAPNRMLLLEYLGDSTYRVVESHNSKMQLGDTFTTGCFIIGYPLYLPHISRDGELTPAFVAGRNGGLTVARLSEKGKVKSEK